MSRERVWQILGVTVAASLLVALVGATHHSIKDAIATQTKKSLCLPPVSPSAAFRCYPTATLLSSQPTTAVATNATGTILASSNRKIIELWELSTGKQLRSLSGHTGWITALAISPNGTMLASADLTGRISLWNLLTGKRTATWNAGSVTVLAFSPDGRTIASGSRLITEARPVRPVQIWEVTSHQLVTALNAGEPIAALAFSPDGHTLAAGATSTWVWDLATQTVLQRLKSGDLNALVFSRDGQVLFTGSDGVRGEDGIKLWAVRSGKLLRVLDSVAADFALSSDGSTLITTYGGTANLWRVQPFGYLGTLRGSTYSGLIVEFGLNGAIVTGSSDGVKVWYPRSITSK